MLWWTACCCLSCGYVSQVPYSLRIRRCHQELWETCGGGGVNILKPYLDSPHNPYPTVYTVALWVHVYVVQGEVRVPCLENWPHLSFKVSE